MRRSAVMRGCIALAAGMALAVALPGVAGRAGAAQKGKAVQLFNGKNFDGWYVFVRGDGKDNDPSKVFTIEPGGIIHVSGEKFGYLSTQKEYENFRFSVDFKWGEKRGAGRENAKRDAGILYNAVGPDKVWMTSLECQIQEGDVGDVYLTTGEGGSPALTVNGKTYTRGRIVKFADYEKPKGEWNTVV